MWCRQETECIFSICLKLRRTTEGNTTPGGLVNHWQRCLHRRVNQEGQRHLLVPAIGRIRWSAGRGHVFTVVSETQRISGATDNKRPRHKIFGCLHFHVKGFVGRVFVATTCCGTQERQNKRSPCRFFVSAEVQGIIEQLCLGLAPAKSGPLKFEFLASSILWSAKQAQALYQDVQLFYFIILWVRQKI